jgi:hypothetical protein
VIVQVLIAERDADDALHHHGAGIDQGDAPGFGVAATDLYTVVTDVEGDVGQLQVYSPRRTP